MLYVFASKKDFGFLRELVTASLIMLILGGFLNILIAQSTALGLGLYTTTVVLFARFVLYDTSKIIRRYPPNEYIAASMDL